MKKFIYVFNSEAKDKLILLGYNLLKEDSFGSTYIFSSESHDKRFSENELNDISYILSDSLTF